MNLTTTLRRTATASIVSLATIFGLTACRDYVVGYVYVTSAQASPGSINMYGIDYQSGALLPIGDPGYVAAGNGPVALVATVDNRTLYVINQGDATVQQFAIQIDGSLISKNVYGIGGTRPTAVTLDHANKFLYVAYTYQTGYTDANPGPGGVAIFPVNTDASLGTPSQVKVGNKPVGVTASYYNNFVYVLDQETSATAQVLGFSENPSSGALTPVPGTVITTVAGKTVATGYASGVVPSAIAEDPTSRFLYVTDQAANQLIGYGVQANGSLLPMVNGPFATGLFPTGITIDPRGTLIYVVNYNASTVQGYMIDGATGTPSGAVGAFATPTGAGPTCVAIDPSLGQFLFTSDTLDNTATGQRIAPGTGGLTTVQNSPFLTQGGPTCLTVVGNGAHATQQITP